MFVQRCEKIYLARCGNLVTTWKIWFIVSGRYIYRAYVVDSVHFRRTRAFCGNGMSKSKTSLGNLIYLYNEVGLRSGKDKRLSVTWSVTCVVGILTLLLGIDTENRKPDWWERATSKCNKKRRKRRCDRSEKKIMERKTRHREKESGKLWAMDKVGKKGNRGGSKERRNGRGSKTIKKHEARKYQREK